LKLNTVFTKTLLWFFGTVILTITAVTLATALNFGTGERRPGPLGALLRIELSEARYAYETGGREQLRRTLQRFERITEAEGVLTDSAGLDLLTGEDRSDLVAAIQERSRIPFFRRNRTVFGRRSADGEYYYFVLLQGENVVAWFLQPEAYLSILGILALLCYAFARYLTNPVRQLQKVVDCFGQGDFSARARISRGDEIGHLAHTFNIMAERIELLMTAERRLLLDISHELRSPLARLSVAVELARMGEDVHSHLDRIQKEADRLNALVGELLQVTRAEGDASRLRSQTVALDELVAAIVEDGRLEAEARGCGIDFQSTPASVAGDPELLRRAVENVVRNAIRYSPQGKNVEVNLGLTNDKAAVEVRDYGPGVPEKALTRLFDAFYRVEPDRDRASGGVGLGLAIARRAIELHHGSILAHNADPGLRVTIQLPNAI
jgi:two-component system sensor histidine kinase CpxA